MKGKVSSYSLWLYKSQGPVFNLTPALLWKAGDNKRSWRLSEIEVGVKPFHGASFLGHPWETHTQTPSLITKIYPLPWLPVLLLFSFWGLCITRSFSSFPSFSPSPQPFLFPFSHSSFFFLLGTESHVGFKVGLELVWPRITLSFWSSCLHFPSPGIVGMHYCARLIGWWGWTTRASFKAGKHSNSDSLRPFSLFWFLLLFPYPSLLSFFSVLNANMCTVLLGAKKDIRWITYSL